MVCARLGSWGSTSLVCCAVYTPIQRESGNWVPPPRAAVAYIYGVRAMRDEATLTALAGPPADTQSYSSVG